MSFIFKFYMKKTSPVDAKKVILEALDGQDMQNYVGRNMIKGKRLKPDIAHNDIFEVIFCANSLTVKDIRGIEFAEGETIRPEVIKHANDVNTKTEQDLKELAKDSEVRTCMTLDQIQDIIDTSNLYGQEFLKPLMALLEEFPIKVDMVKVDEADEAAYQRKVSKN